MRRVNKGAEPACLAEVRREVERIESEAGSRLGDRWAQVKDCKLEIQQALIRDQGGLCAYCGGRLTQKMKVEHFVPRSADQDLILDWNNLLGCCNGEYREGNKRILHCDSSRTPHAEGPPVRGRLHTHPVKSPIDPTKLFVVNVTGGEKGQRLGEIQATTPEAEHDLRELNLNASRLVENRRRVVEQLRLELSKRSETEAKQFVVRRFKAAINTQSSELPAYAHVAAEYLRRKLKRYGLQT